MKQAQFDDLLAARCAAAVPSASFEESIAQTLQSLEDATEIPSHLRRPVRPRGRVPLWATRAAAVVAAVVLCVGGTAFAAEKLGLNLWQTNNHQVQISPQASTDAPDAAAIKDEQGIDEYQLTFSYIPDRLPDRSTDVDSGSFSAYEGFEGWSQLAPTIQYSTYYVDTTEPVSLSSIERAETIEVQGREAALLHLDYGVRFSKRATQTCLYVAFPEVRRVVQLKTSDEELVDELVPIAEGMAFEATGKTTPLVVDSTWSDAIVEANYDAEMIAERQAGDYSGSWGALSDLTLTDEQMGPFLARGESFPVPGNSALTATVTHVEFHRDAPFINREEMPFGWRAIVGEDGSIKEDTLAFVKFGDGRSTTDAIVKQVSSPLRLLEVQMTITNEGESTQSNVWCVPRLESATHREGTWTQYQRAAECAGADEVQNGMDINEKSCYYVERMDEGIIGTLDDDLGSLAPGEKKTVRCLWLVNADEADKLLLDIDPDGYGDYADGTFGQRFVDIRSQ